MTSKKQSSLAKVQNLYLMQVELWNFLDEKNLDVEKTKSAQKTLKEFKELLKEVDWQLMGGEDVLESLQMIPTEVSQKLKKATPGKKGAIKKSPAKKVVVKKATKKPTAKKAPTKKKAPAKKK